MGIKREHFFPRAQFAIDLFSNLLKYNKEKLHASKSGLPLICDKFLAKHRAKEGEVFFILGSGESINSISSKQWSFIKSQRSIGLNHWMCHLFVPDFYMIEGLRLPEGQKLQTWRDNNLKSYFEENKSLIILLKDLRKSYFSNEFLSCIKKNNSYAIPKFSIPGRDNLLRNRNIKRLSSLGILGKLPFFSCASITLAISFASLLNFKNIVLCGVDLKNGRYFWQHEEFCHGHIPPPPSEENIQIHPTIDQRESSITVDQSLYSLDKFYLRPNGINLSVLFESSKLYPKISKYIPS